jgi:hypothetical protein
MADSNSFICATCGASHAEIPGLGFTTPFQYGQLSADEKKTAFLNSDICAIGEDRFVRGCIEVPVQGQDESFIWGVWVSLSKSSLDQYLKEMEESAPEDGPYFGWLCNRLPFYPETLHLKTNVYFRSGDLRPRVVLQLTDHPLAAHQEQGISPETLRQVIEAHLHTNNSG